MGNPLLLLTTRPWSRPGRRSLRRVAVEVPTDVPGTDAIFLALRRMRAPLIVLIAVFTIAVAGMTLIPGQDAAGRPVQISVFEAFYFMSYTGTTIGFGELPYTFTTSQRIWVTISIYGTVTGWAYAIGSLFALLQDSGFTEAIGLQRFRRRVQRLSEPFYLVVGYGQAGRVVCRGLDDLGRRFVVVDSDRARIDVLGTDPLAADAPGIEGDGANPAVLGLAGLGHSSCAGVLALTDNDATNLAVVMAAHLLRPDLPVIARCDDRATAEHMLDFSPHAVVNPYDNYGAYLVLALQHPVTYQLVGWLMNPRGTPMPERHEGLGAGRWVICADGRFGREVAADLTAAGLEVTLTDPGSGHPEVAGAVGFIAGAEQDGTNLSMAARARLDNPGVFVAVRQRAMSNAALLTAFRPDSVFVPTDLVAREVLARVLSPLFGSVIDHAVQQDEDWSQRVLDEIRSRCGDLTPGTWRVDLDARQAPAVLRWLDRHELTLRDLLRDPDDRTVELPLVPLLLVRGSRSMMTPELDEQVRAGDTVLLAGRTRGFDALSATLFGDSAVRYVATGAEVPSTWLWRILADRRRAAG